MKKLLPLLLCVTVMTAQNADRKTFVGVDGTHFTKNGKPYHYIGANYWYGAILGSKKYGDRKRLARELDQMKANGIDNLRILVGADGGGYDFTVREPLQPKQGTYDDALLDGLDYLLSEMGKRGMTAVLYLTNNWEWSGGMSQYLEWNGYGPIPNPNLNGGTWPAFMAYVTQFHSCSPCKEALEKHIRFIIGRTNAYTKKKYTEDPAIMAWQVANEPRIFTVENEKAFTEWLNATVDLIDQLDPNHLISTGSEGSAGSNADQAAFERTHQNPHIDYLTMHIWPKNWGWFDHAKEQETLPVAIANASEYLERHIASAEKLGRPIVVEEFGLPRRGEALTADTSVESRNTFYDLFFTRLQRSVEKHEALAGVNFWGYGGEGRAANEKGKWNKDDAYTADPPQEPQGLNSVFSSDATTLDLIRSRNEALRKR